MKRTGKTASSLAAKFAAEVEAKLRALGLAIPAGGVKLVTQTEAAVICGLSFGELLNLRGVKGRRLPPGDRFPEPAYVCPRFRHIYFDEREVIAWAIYTGHPVTRLVRPGQAPVAGLAPIPADPDKQAAFIAATAPPEEG